MASISFPYTLNPPLCESTLFHQQTDDFVSLFSSIFYLYFNLQSLKLLFVVYSFMDFDKYIESYVYHHNPDKKQFHQSQILPYSAPLSSIITLHP